jgi:hypothetical protein
MRCFALLLTCAALVAAQEGGPSRTSVYTYDANGRRVLDSQTVRNGGAESRIRTINGSTAPLEKVDEKILSQDGDSKVIERVIRPYDPTGNPGPPTKIRITERKNADGSKSVETQTFEGNLNGGFTLREKETALTRLEGAREITETQVARPTLNGSVDVIEKQSSTVTKFGEAKSSADTVLYRRDFYAAVRETRETETAGGKTVENSATYIRGVNSQMELAGQKVSETVKRADGSQTQQVSIFGVNNPGRPATGQAVLREVQILDRQPTASGAVETLSIRRPAIDDPNKLGPAKKISEKVCTGPCKN